MSDRSNERASIGVLMRARRQELGLSLQRVADSVGCAKSYLSSVETEQRNPPAADLLRKLEEVLMLPAGKLVSAAAWQRGLEAGGSEVREGIARLQDQQRTAQRLATLLKGKGVGSTKSVDDLYRSGELK